MTDVDGQSAESDSVSNPESEANTTNGAEATSEAEPVIESSVTKTYDYFYLGDKLGRMTITTTVDGGAPATETIDFFYDASGYPYALKYKGKTYYYITNLQGDVMSIVDGSGKPVAEYSYDPYGNVLTATGTLAEINPLRYRSYYYDTECSMYYFRFMRSMT